MNNLNNPPKSVMENITSTVISLPTIPKGSEAVFVTEVEHFTDSVFRFQVTRPTSFRFRSGEFAMIGLPVAEGERPVFRAYSLASPVWSETLEFYSIKVPDGPLTSRLAHIVVGDTVLLKPKATGTLINDALIGGRDLWLLGTGTGIAPYASLIRDPETYDKFDNVYLVHGTRSAAELAYSQHIFAAAQHCPLVGKEVQTQLHYYPTTTRDNTRYQGRITTLINNGKLFADLMAHPLHPDYARVMICGSMAMLDDLKAMCLNANLLEGSNSQPGEFVIERAFVG